MITGLQQSQLEWAHAENMTCPYCKGNRIVHRGSQYKCITPRCSYTADATDPSSSASGPLAAAIAIFTLLVLL